MKVPKIQIPKIPKEENILIISQLLEVTEQQSVIIQLQGEEIQLLKDEIACLENTSIGPSYILL